MNGDSSNMTVIEDGSVLKSNERKAIYNLTRDWPKYLMLAMPLLHILIFTYIPMHSIRISFQRINILKGMCGNEWVVLKCIFFSPL